MKKYIITEKQLNQLVEYVQLNENSMATLFGAEGGNIVFEKENIKHYYKVHVDVHLPFTPKGNVFVSKISPTSDGGYLMTGKIDGEEESKSVPIGKDRVNSILNLIPKDKIVSKKQVSTITLTKTKKGVT